MVAREVSCRGLTMLKQIAAMLHATEKQDESTTFWLAYNARSNVAYVELARVLDRRIDFVPTRACLRLFVGCQVIHMGLRSPSTQKIVTAPTPLDQPLIFFHLTSFPLSKNHIPQTVGYFPVNVDSTKPIPARVFTPQLSLLQVRLDVPVGITREVDTVEGKWHISGFVLLMVMLNGLNPDDMSTRLTEISISRITKAHWPW